MKKSSQFSPSIIRKNYPKLIIDVELKNSSQPANRAIKALRRTFEQTQFVVKSIIVTRCVLETRRKSQERKDFQRLSHLLSFPFSRVIFVQNSNQTAQRVDALTVKSHRKFLHSLRCRGIFFGSLLAEDSLP